MRNTPSNLFAYSITDPAEPRSIILGTTASAGMVVFALTAHTALPLFLLAILGLCLTALSIAVSVSSTTSPVRLFGLTRVTSPVLIWGFAGLLLGTGLAFLFRYTSHRPLVLTGLEPFVITAAAIGAAEELLFRGFIQGRLAKLGWPAAVGLAALAHTAYKLCLFTFPPDGVAISFSILGSFTLVVGILLGLIRHASGSVLPAVTAHALFDILGYGDWVSAPWWVWG